MRVQFIYNVYVCVYICMCVCKYVYVSAAVCRVPCASDGCGPAKQQRATFLDWVKGTTLFNVVYRDYMRYRLGSYDYWID